MSRMEKETGELCLKRLTKIEGQVRGIARMVEEKRYCIDIITQISAVRAALRKVEEAVLQDHVGHCVEHAIASGNAAEQRKKLPNSWKYWLVRIDRIDEVKIDREDVA